MVQEVECEEIVPIAIHTLSLGEAALLWLRCAPTLDIPVADAVRQNISQRTQSTLARAPREQQQGLGSAPLRRHKHRPRDRPLSHVGVLRRPPRQRTVKTEINREFCIAHVC